MSAPFEFILKWLPIAACVAGAVWFLSQDSALGAQGAVMTGFLAGMWWMMNTDMKK